MDIKELIGEKVGHNKFGEGIITEASGNYINVKFADADKKFSYPKVFDGFLMLKDISLQEKLIEDIERVKEAEAKEIEEKAKIAVQTKNNKSNFRRSLIAEKIQVVSRHTLLERGLKIGDAFNTICEIVNTCFGTDYKGYQRAWFKINDKYAAWFPKLAVYENGRPHAASEKGWVNILSDDGRMIFETNEINEDYPMEAHKTNPQYFKHRITFSKADGAAYRFVGVFAFKEYSKEKGNIYERIMDSIDITDLQVKNL